MSDDRYDNHRYHNEDTFNIQSTAGAVSIRNEKGEVTMKKVKVNRYVSGKRPDYAAGGSRHTYEDSSEEEESDNEDFTQYRRPKYQRPHSPSHGSHGDVLRDQDNDVNMKEEDDQPDLSDPRIRRLMAAKISRKEYGQDKDETEILSRRRRIHEPEVLSGEEDVVPDESDDSDESSSGDEEMDEETVKRRRELMRQRALAKAQIGIEQEEIMDKEEEKPGSDEEEEETSEEETTDSEEDEETKLKPVFVRKRDRLTVQEREREDAKEFQAEREKQIMAETRKKDTRRLIENIVKENAVERKAKDNDLKGLNEVITDDENDETEYEAWKLRELKRVKREREEKENVEKDRMEIERVRNMTDEERRMESKNNPRLITNKAAKGKYKFLQKYYHRGAFFLADEENVYKRDYSEATLEDKFDKTVLPKVMQVKNFGRSGRTKYTHLVDQDTTQFDSAWTTESNQNLKFQLQHAGGMKQNFERPSSKKKK